MLYCEINLDIRNYNDNLSTDFYTIGVWSEHRSKKLKKLHLLFFWLVPYILGMIIGMS